MSRAFFLASLVALIVVLAAAPAARAQDIQLTRYGLRGGVSLDDELLQLLAGGQVDLGRVAENVRLQPLATIGIGDDALTLFAAAEAHYLFPVQEGSRIEPYAGGGIGVHHIDPDDADEETEVALSIVAGADIPANRWWSWFVEGRFVIADQTVFRVEGGINWVY